MRGTESPPFYFNYFSRSSGPFPAHFSPSGPSPCAAYVSVPSRPEHVLQEIKEHQEKLKALIGIKESDTGLSLPSQWDLNSDKQMQQEEQPLQVARCTKIIDPGSDDAKYVINVKQIAKFVVGLGEKVAPTDVEEGMRVGVDRTKYSIQIPLPPKIDPSVSLMTVEEKPDVT